MKIVEVRHPLVQHKIGLLRDAQLNTRDFRELVTELGTLLAYEATSDLETTSVTMEGWAGPVEVQKIAGAKITLVPILRAGLGMLPGVLALLPSARVSVVGLQRDETTLQPLPYFEKLAGRLDERTALILDPMLATGGTLIATIDMLKRSGCRRIKGIFLVAAPGPGRGGSGACGRRGLHSRHRRTAQRARLHPAGSGRCGGPHIRHPVSLAIAAWTCRIRQTAPARAVPLLRAPCRSGPWHRASLAPARTACRG